MTASYPLMFFLINFRSLFQLFSFAHEFICFALFLCVFALGGFDNPGYSEDERQAGSDQSFNSNNIKQ
jgi:hypothetical protein